MNDEREQLIRRNSLSSINSNEYKDYISITSSNDDDNKYGCTKRILNLCIIL